MSNKHKYFNEAIPAGILNTSLENKPPLNQAVKLRTSTKDLSEEEEIKESSKIVRESQIKLSRKSSIELEIDSKNFFNINKDGSKTSLSPTTKQILNRVNSAKSEKNFIDLNKSLAKLASRRVAGHSPDNSNGRYPKETYNTKNLQFHMNLMSSKKSWDKSPHDTPKRMQEKLKNSSRKDLDQTPEMYYEKGGLNKNNVHFAPCLSKKDTSLANNSADLNKYKNNGQLYCRDKNLRIQTETSTPIEYTEYESKNLAKFFSQGIYFTEGCEDTSENVIEVETDEAPESKFVKNLDADKINMRKYQAYKKNIRNPKVKKQVHIVETEPSQCPNGHTSKIPKPKKMMINTEPSETTIRIERFYTQLEESNRKQLIDQEHENNEPINLNSISDGVEYSNGGVGFSAFKSRNQSNKSKVMGSRDPISRLAVSKHKMKTMETDKIQTWKHDLITIKRDIENRKHSFDEVNRFVSQLYDDEKQLRPSEAKERKEMAPESAEKPSDEHPICKINLGKLNLDSTITLAPNVKSPNSIANMSGINTSKLTQELRTTTDGNDEKSPVEASGGHASPAHDNKHIRTSYCEFTYETNELNTSFAENVANPTVTKPACCGYSKCEIF